MASFCVEYTLLCRAYSSVENYFVVEPKILENMEDSLYLPLIRQNELSWKQGHWIKENNR